jgi:DNA polymerase-1
MAIPRGRDLRPLPMRSKDMCLYFDGNLMLRRNWAAVRDENKAVNYFVARMRNLARTLAPEYMAVMFDSDSEYFRSSLYPEYKKNRAERDPIEELSFDRTLQLAKIQCESRGIPWIQIESFEADDLLATYARLGREKDCCVVMCTADKDLFQVLGPDTYISDPTRQFMFLSDRYCQYRFAVEPHQFVDLQALAGDEIDNVDNVPGVSEQGAAKLLNSNGGTLQSLYAAIDRGDVVVPLRQAERVKAELVKHREDVFHKVKIFRLEDRISPLPYSLGDISYTPERTYHRYSSHA